MTTYVFYVLWETKVRDMTIEITYNTVTAVDLDGAMTLQEGYNKELAHMGTWTTLGVETYESSPKNKGVPLSRNWSEERYKELLALGKLWPIGYKGYRGISAGKVPELPFEVHNPRKPDPNRCIEMMRALCEGYRS